MTCHNPEHPDGSKYRFNCCRVPRVMEDNEGNCVCRNCGYDWSDVEGVQKE